MKIADPMKKTIYEINTTIEALKTIADPTHTIQTMAQELNVDCMEAGKLDKNIPLPQQIDAAFYNGAIMTYNPETGQFA